MFLHFLHVYKNALCWAFFLPVYLCPQEFDNAEGEEYASEFSAQGSPATQNGPEVYILPLTEVSLPMSRQPGRSGKPSKLLCSIPNSLPTE